MDFNIKPGDLSRKEEMESFVITMKNRAYDADLFKVDLEHTSALNLSQFNQLLMLYTKTKRLGRNLVYYNFNSEIKSLVDKTNFHHIFSAENYNYVIEQV